MTNSNTTRLFVLGASDPEMEMIEKLLRESGEVVAYATMDGKRVHPGNAYTADAVLVQLDNRHAPKVGMIMSVDADEVGLDVLLSTTDLFFVECDVMSLRQKAKKFSAEWKVTFHSVDHHRQGDPGYGKPAEEFLLASSIGQVIAELAQHDQLPVSWGRYCVGQIVPGKFWDKWIQESDESVSWEHRWIVGGKEGVDWVIPTEFILVAAADHCLPAAYRSQCPGVNPDWLMKWRVSSRAKFQNLSEKELLARVESAREKIRQYVSDYNNGVMGNQSLMIGPIGSAVIFDTRGEIIPELPEAAVREGIAYLAIVKDRGGREKVVLGSASPEQVQWFLDHYPAVEKYGDPARGFAGGYLK